jgi:hypothetical protein
LSSPRVMRDLPADGWMLAVRREDDRFSWRERVTEFDHSGDSGPPCQDSNSAATTSNPRTRTGRTSASLETTGEAGKSLMGEPLRNPLAAKQRSSPTRPRWVQACASPDPLPQRVETPLRADNMLPWRPRVKLMRARRADLRADGEIWASWVGLGCAIGLGIMPAYAEEPVVDEIPAARHFNCLGCDTHQTVALDTVRRPKTTPIHEAEVAMPRPFP